MSDANVIDWAAVLEGLKGDRNLVEIVVEAAREESPRLLESIRQALAAGDRTKLRLAAHTLKGSIRYFHASRPFDLAFQMERAAQNGSLDGAPAILADLEAEMDWLLAALAEYPPAK